jgi:hypothetical protein
MHQMLVTLCIASSLALVVLGDSDLIGGFHLRTLSVEHPSAIMGPILDMIVVSHDVEGVSCEELGWHVNSCLLGHFTAPARARRFASSVVTPRGYKAGGRSYVQHTSSHMISHRLLASFPTTEKKEREREGNKSRNKRELLSLHGVASPSLLNHGGVGLIHVIGHARTPAKPCESGVYDGGRACDLPQTRGSRIPYPDGGICHGTKLIPTFTS